MWPEAVGIFGLGAGTFVFVFFVLRLLLLDGVLDGRHLNGLNRGLEVRLDVFGVLFVKDRGRLFGSEGGPLRKARPGFEATSSPCSILNETSSAALVASVDESMLSR